MHRVKLYAAEGGLGLVVTGRAMPDLRLEIASGGRMLLRQQGLVLLGKVHRWNYGVHVYRTGDYVSPLPPLRADHARQVTPHGSAAWFDRWAYQLASWLDDADTGPLHSGYFPSPAGEREDATCGKAGRPSWVRCRVSLER